MNIGEQIKAARKAAKPSGQEVVARKRRILDRLFSRPGITLEELSARGCGSKDHISRCENGTARPSNELLGAIYKATGYEFEIKIGGSDE